MYAVLGASFELSVTDYTPSIVLR